MTVPSDTSIEEYPWFDMVSGMKEWVDELQVGNIQVQDWTIENLDWENTVEVKRNDIADDKIKIYSPLFKMMGETAAIHPDALLAEFLYGGLSTACYDGQYFFDTDHPIPGTSSTQSNAGTAVLAEAAFEAAELALLKMKMGNTVYLNRSNSMKLKLIIPPSLKATAEDIVMAAHKSSGATNLNQGKAEIVVLPELEAYSSTNWYLMNTGRQIRGMIFQMREQPFVDVDDQKTSKFVKYFATGRYAMGYGLYHFGYGSDGTV
jgi:phage major head subunit gpT-like protein